MKRINRWASLLTAVWLLFSSAHALSLSAGGDCGPDFCPIPTVNENNEPVYAVVSPTGYHAVEMIEQPPRLDTLEGKRIALVGGSFNAAVTHDELRKCILETFPDAEIFMLQEVGSGGPYSVFGLSSQTVSFQNRLKDLRIDAVISGNCGCGLCTVKEAGSSMAAEAIGIPSVTVGAPTFIAQIHSLGVSRGIPVLRTAEYPGAFSADSEEEMRRKTRQTVWPAVKEALTAPITLKEAQQYADSGKRPFDEVIYTGTFDEVQEFFQTNEWTDGLPVVPPTDEKVRDYLRFTPYPAEKILGVYALAYRECSVYTVAANAVMAGVPRELMPVCVALTQALGDGEWRRPLASTHGWSPYAWLNGPLARQLGIDCGQGMISSEKNKALGRFMDLMMLNLGGYYIKENRMGTFGYLTPFTFAEDEEACLSAGWEPYHVTRGYSLNDNTVTASSALSWGNNVTPSTDDPEQIMQLLAFDITEKQQNGLGNTNPQVYRTVLITAPVAADLAKGYAGKDDLEDDLIHTARRPLFMRAYASYWANTGSIQSGEYTFEEYYKKLQQDPQEQAALTEVPDWLSGVAGSERIETIAAMQKGQTSILVAGDGARNKFMVLPGGGNVTIEIALPDGWDELVAPMGYEPLSRFELAEPAPKQAENAAQDISLSKALTDGEYRIVSSADLLTEPGRIFKSDSGAASAWRYGDTAASSLPAADGGFSLLMKNLFPGCSLTVTKGTVSAVTLRPAAAGRKTGTVALPAEMLEKLRVTVKVVTRQSSQEGKRTEDGASVVLSARLARFTLDLGGELRAGSGNTPHFLSLNGTQVTLNPSAAAGSAAVVGARNPDGTWKTMTFTKQDERNVLLQYRESAPSPD